MDNWQYDVFISYNQRDEDFVDFLEACLISAGLRCFRDRTGLELYQKLDAALKAAISRSRWLVAVISPSYLQSYWCLFEALEAIQGQDLSLRFHPIVLRRSPSQKVLDEDFVMEVLSDLREQIRIYELKIVAERAFHLSAKLEKLQFVQNQLPKIFKSVTERIYQQFDLWNEHSVQSAMKKLLGHFSPGHSAQIEDVPLNLVASEPEPPTAPRLTKMPIMVWKTYVGCQAWKNNPVAIGNDILVPSSGREWNKSDDSDGLYCLSAETGKMRWFAPTPADANSIQVSKGMVIVGCDDGTVGAYNLANGNPFWTRKFESAITGGPIRLPSNTGGGMAEGERPVVEPVFVQTYDGNLYLLEQNTGETISGRATGETLIGKPTFAEIQNRKKIIIPTASGKLLVIDYDYIDNGFRSTSVINLIKLIPKDKNELADITGCAAQPTIVENFALLGIVRDTYANKAPIISVDLINLDAKWFSEFDAGQTFGNLRSSPLVIGKEIIFAPAYTSSLFAYSLTEKKLEWSIELGQKMFEQWSSPIAVQTSIYIGRHDGYLHKVSSTRKRREWSIYLGNEARAGSVITGGQTVPEFNDTSSWKAGASSPILASPIYDRGRLYIGTHEGWLYCIGNIGDTNPDF